MMLDRIVAMQTRLGRYGYPIREEPAEFADAGIDPDPDTDSDPDEQRSQGTSAHPCAAWLRCSRSEPRA